MRTLHAFRHRRRTRAIGRSGFSLIEVILATAILLGSVVVLSRLVGMGRIQAEKARLHSEAQRICEMTLHEIVLGLRPLQAVELSPLEAALDAFPESPEQQEQQGDRGNMSVDNDIVRRRAADPLGSGSSANWLHSVRLAPHPTVPTLTILTVEVQQADESLERPVRFELTRWARQSSGSDPASEFSFGLSSEVERRSVP